MKPDILHTLKNIFDHEISDFPENSKILDFTYQAALLRSDIVRSCIVMEDKVKGLHH